MKGWVKKSLKMLYIPHKYECYVGIFCQKTGILNQNFESFDWYSRGKDQIGKDGYPRVRNTHTGTVINFWGFFQGLLPY